MSGRIGGRMVKDGLVLHLDAANTASYSSGSTWVDLSFNNAVLTTTGGTTGSSVNVGGVFFNGTTGNFVSNLIVQPPNNQLTISCWFKATGPSNNNDSAGGVMIVDTPQLNFGYALTYSWLEQRFGFTTKVNDAIDTGLNSVLRNTVYNATCTYNGSQQIIYINGEFNTARTYSINVVYPSSGDRNLKVGNWGQPTFPRNFNGNIYQMLLYNRALTATEAKQNFLALRGRFGL